MENDAITNEVNMEPEINLKKDTTLYLSNVSKTFGSTRALNGVTLSVMPGEIHGLLGQNGCGKSTLIKILAGFHEPDKGGKLWINGEKVKLPLAPGEFESYGISFVHQDLGLVNELTVLENWTLGEMANTNSFNIPWKLRKKQMLEVFKKYDLNIDPEEQVSGLTPVEKALLAILRAVVTIQENEVVKKKKRGVLVLDEPTVFLPKTGVDILFSLVRTITKEGMSVIFVSHDLDEVMELTDRFTVLRDGYNVGQGVTKELQKDDVIRMILGKEIELYHTEQAVVNSMDSETNVRVTNLRGNVVYSESFDVKKGEILGITGLVGSGYEEIPLLLMGANEPVNSGMMEINDEKIDLTQFDPVKAVKHEIAMIPADRPNMGSILTLPIKENIMMQSYKHYNPFYLKKKKMEKQAKTLVEDYEVHPNDIELNLGQLSGGNQQKVLLAKWIQENPTLLILHEPTQGIDIGARQQVYKLIEDTVKKKNTSVICCSSSYEELEQICDRVLIMVQGQIIKELVGNEINKETITRLCYETVEM